MQRQKTQKRWSAKEIAILEENYPFAGTSGCAPLLPGRSRTLIRQKAHYMGLKLDGEAAPAWTEEEMCLLQEVFPEEGPSCAARFPSRSRGAVLRKAERMGLTSQCGSLGETADPTDCGCGQSPDAERQGIQPRKWTATEERTLRRYYPSEKAACAARLPGRSPQQVLSRAWYLGLSDTRRPRR